MSVHPKKKDKKGGQTEDFQLYIDRMIQVVKRRPIVYEILNYQQKEESIG